MGHVQDANTELSYEKGTEGAVVRTVGGAVRKDIFDIALELQEVAIERHIDLCRDKCSPPKQGAKYGANGIAAR